MFRSLFLSVSLVAMSSLASAATIGLSKPDETNKFQETIWKTIEGAAAKNNTTLRSSAAQMDATVQTKQVSDFYAANTDAVIAALTTTKASGAIVESARKAQKPIVFVSTSPAPDLLGDGVYFIGSEEHEAGTLEMNEVCRRMNGKGKIVVLIGDLSVSAAKIRTTAIHDVLKTPRCSGIEILEEQSAGFDHDQAREVVRTWLAAGLKPDAIVANNDEMAMGAIASLKEAGVKDVIVAGVDATDEALAAMQAGDLAVTVLQDGQAQGRLALDIAQKAIAGEKPPVMTRVPFKLITPDRASQLVADRSGG